MAVLIFSYPSDPHYRAVAEKLAIRSQPYYLIDYTNPRLTSQISCRIPHNNDLTISVTDDNGTTFNLRNISAVWLRRTRNPGVRESRPEDVVNPRYQYVRTENRSLLHTFHHVLKDRFWLPDLQSEMRAEHKPIQLLTAYQFGLQIPETWIGNAPQGLAKFLAQITRPSYTVKPLYDAGYTVAPSRFKKGLVRFLNATAMRFARKKLYLNTYRGSCATCVDPEFLSQRCALVANCPIQVQEYVEKLIELRITIVGEQFFTCAIDSQKHASMRHDWRQGDPLSRDQSQSIFTLPDDIKQKCLNVMRALGLSFGCIDMIITPENEYVFLEINPNGQWLWIEESLGLDISGGIATALLCENKRLKVA